MGSVPHANGSSTWLPYVSGVANVCGVSRPFLALRTMRPPASSSAGFRLGADSGLHLRLSGIPK